MMENLIYKFIAQIEEAVIIAESTRLQTNSVNKVFITGMGGSGIAGKFVAEIMKLHGTVPVITSNTYDVPEWIDENTLALVSSYSGNTEETVEAFEKLIEKKAKIITVTSGGTILRKSVEEKIEVMKMPADWGAPRACIGYSIVFQLYILKKFEILKLELSKELSLVIEHLINLRDSINQEAVIISRLMGDKIPLIYSDVFFEPVAIRFRQQLNENSKILAFNSVFPEMNHNEIAAWTYDLSEFAAIFIQSDFYDKRVAKRIEISKEIMIRYTDKIIDINIIGGTILQQYFYAIHLTDWISWFIAKIRNVDAMDISNIVSLKNQLR